MSARRGTSNTNERGNVEDRRRRREWLVKTSLADRVLVPTPFTPACVHPAPATTAAAHVPACRCYRCGRLLHAGFRAKDGSVVEATVTVDRIVPGCKGGTYRRSNIRPACAGCNSETGGALASRKGKR